MPTILLVEDNPMTRKIVRFALERDGCELLEAPDAKTALEILESRIPDLVLQDLCLPDMDGFALAVQLRAKCGPNVPLLCFSGFISKADEAHVAAAGFDGVVPKPVEPSRLVQIIRGHLPLPGEHRPLGGRTVIVADDDPIQLKLMCFRLDRLGYTVVTAGDGEEALALARVRPPDAIVSDVMMPRLDGFGLAMAVRSEPALAEVPLVLVTSTYVEPNDRDLARRAGVNEFVLRTPDLRGVVEALHAALETQGRGAAPPPLSAPVLEVERERVLRVQRQLERQVSLNAGLTQRCAMQASELAVLTGITEAVVKSGDLSSALDDVLAMCFDAGGVSVGALYLLDAGGKMRARVLGGAATWTQEDLDGFFGCADLLRQAIERGRPLLLTEPPWELAGREVLARSGAISGLVLPLVYGGSPLGALFVISRSRQFDDPDWLAFAQGVADQLTLAVALTRSIEARAAADALAVESRSQLRAILDAAPDFVLHVDRQGAIRFINRVVSPYTIDEVIGRDWLAYIAAEHRALMKSALDSVLETGTPASYEVMGMGPDDSLAWYASHLAPVRRNGGVTGVVVMARDITQKKQMEAQLMVSDRMASVGTLAAGVAHEINNPLAAVMINLELALRASEVLAQRLGEGEVGELQEELRDARDAAERVRQIVRDLKIFARAEDEERREPVDVKRVLESTLRMGWNEIRHRARLVKEYGQVPAVDANESRLGQVFLNLIVNAAQAIVEGNAEGNEIRIVTSVDPKGRVQVEIRDTGPGIPPEVLGRLFTPFFTTKPSGVGTGLGLAICQRIVTSLSGEISVESQVGRGTTFRVLLPPSRVEAVEAPMALAPLQRAIRRGRILVIDDEPMIGAAIRRTFAMEHDVTVAKRAQEALELVAAGNRFDVILCDLMMPQMTGMDLYEQLRDSVAQQASRIIFLTGGAFTQRAREFLDHVPNLRIEKPFDSAHLRSLVNDRIR